ncbi:TetR/AcrR family transcriptional regulator [Flexibacterium corallicola]|uniref:TetR/AcrR family transcriptional regulator n=1 Tax=Flexibacterium corallicola TaxID=3037259 RepID=UPI00286EF7CE|nr:TetR/AcrR family transcriptional regulator [Pseudovibrio sp. M1P-2-3]
MTDSSELGTRGRLLDSAESLLAENGLGSTSVRMITEMAGANVAAVNYHFGSKEDLVRAVILRRLSEIDDMRMQRLDALEVGGRSPSIEEITRAFIEPLIVHGISRETGKMVPFIVLVRQVMSDPEVGQKLTHGWETPLMVRRMARAITSAANNAHLSESELKFMIFLMHSSAVEILYTITGNSDETFKDQSVRDGLVERGLGYVASGIKGFISQKTLEEA